MTTMMDSRSINDRVAIEKNERVDEDDSIIALKQIIFCAYNIYEELNVVSIKVDGIALCTETN